MTIAAKLDRSLPAWRRIAAAVAALAVLLIVWFVSVYFDVWRYAYLDEAQPADVIVVLGAAEYYGRPSPILKARLDHALELYRRNLSQRIITTGGHGEGSEFSEGEVSREYLSQNGVPAEFISVEMYGRSTMESSAAVIEIMDRMKLHSCIVVSDGYHIYRIKRMLEDYGFEVYGSPREPGMDSRWTRAWYYAREAAIYLLWRVGVKI
jgi:uncharacterized SAM-binding protein YcdF (DUF218 family)